MESREKLTREMVEEKGKIFEKFGLTPMQGRIVAYLTLSDSPETTFEEFVRYFKTSKSSVSNSLNLLLQVKIIDYRTISAKRRRYFYITDAFFRIFFEKIIGNVIELKEDAIRTVSMRSPDHPEVNAKMLKWISDSNMFQEALEKTLAELKKEAF